MEGHKLLIGFVYASRPRDTNAKAQPPTDAAALNLEGVLGESAPNGRPSGCSRNHLDSNEGRHVAGLYMLHHQFRARRCVNQAEVSRAVTQSPSSKRSLLCTVLLLELVLVT